MQIYLLLNQDCNLNCGFCIRGKKQNEWLNLREWEKVLSENDFSRYTLLITGGEPSLHKQMVDIIDVSRKKFKGICINTNGVRADWVEKVDRTAVHVQISLDGPREVHNSLRAQKSADIYEKILHTISVLESRDISYNISTTVARYNYEAVLAFLGEMSTFQKMKYWKISPMLPFGCASKEDVLEVEEWNWLVDAVLAKARVRVITHKLFNFEVLDKYIKSGKIEHVGRVSNCGDVKSKLYVYPDLSVYPCTCLTDFPIGNLKKQSLMEIISSEAAKKFVYYRVEEDSDCAKCKYLKYCNGGCIGMSYHYFGELGRGDYRCPLVKKELRTLK